MTGRNNIAIVVIGRNEGERLKKCLHSVLKSGAVIVYVDSNSTDGSVAYAQSVGVKVILLDDKKPLTAARARNSGFECINSNNPNIDYIHFIDGDCEMAEGWLMQAVAALEKCPDVSAVCGRLREKNITRTIYTRLCDMSWYVKPGEIEAVGGIATMRADVFREHKGFNEDLIAGEEPELCLRIRNSGWKILCLDTQMGTHDSDMSTYNQWWVRSVRTGFAYANAVSWGRWQGERKSIIFWGAIIPILIVSGILTSPFYGSLLILIYPFQIFRVTYKLSIPYKPKDKLLYGLFCVLDKFPMFVGMIKFYYSRLINTQ